MRPSERRYALIAIAAALPRQAPALLDECAREAQKESGEVRANETNSTP